MNIDEWLRTLTPEIYQNLKKAVEIRKWPNGKSLTEDELQTCMQAIITYEFHHVPEQERIGYIPPLTSSCKQHKETESPESEPLKWQNT